VYDELPDTVNDEAKVRAQIKRLIDMRVNPIEGFTSNYDYEKNEWKTKK
jgi:cytochrome c oxidase subunit 4